jgi:Ion transport protein
MMFVVAEGDSSSGSEEDTKKVVEKEPSPVPRLPQLQPAGRRSGSEAANAAADALFGGGNSNGQRSVSRTPSPPSSAQPLLPGGGTGAGYGPRYSSGVPAGSSPPGFNKQPIKSALKKAPLMVAVAGAVTPSPSGFPPSSNVSSPGYSPKLGYNRGGSFAEEETPKVASPPPAPVTGAAASAGGRPSSANPRGPPPIMFIQDDSSSSNSGRSSGNASTFQSSAARSAPAPAPDRSPAPAPAPGAALNSRPGGIGGMRSSSKNRRHTPYNRAALSALKDEDEEEEEEDDDEDEDGGRGNKKTMQLASAFRKASNKNIHKSSAAKGSTAKGSAGSSQGSTPNSASLRGESKRRNTPFVPATKGAKSADSSSRGRRCCAGCCRWFTGCKSWWGGCCRRSLASLSSDSLDVPGMRGDSFDGEGRLVKVTWQERAMAYWQATRQFCRELDSSPIFVWPVNFVIFWSCINLALDGPYLQGCTTSECSAMSGYLAVSDVIITVVFTLEFVVQLIARGVLRGQEAYFRSGWRWVDALTTAASIASLVASSESSKALRALRAARALRPLRLIARIPRLKLVVDALLGSFPRARNVLFLIFVVTYLLALIGLLFFRGHFYACNDTSITTEALCVGYFYPESEQCDLLPTYQQAFDCLGGVAVAVPHVWAPRRFCFDSIGESLQTVFDLFTGEGWPNIALVGIDSGVGGPVRGRTLGAAAYYILTELVLNIILLELVASVVVDTYQRLKNERNGASLLSREQASFMANIRVAMGARPPQIVKPPKMKGQHPKVAEIRKKIFKLVGSSLFEWLVIGIVALSAIASSLTFYGQSAGVLKVQEVINWIVTVLFVAEAGLKMFGLGLQQYFQSSWNIFDFVLCAGSILSAILQAGIVGTILRVFRIARLFRIVRVSTGLQRLLRSIGVSWPSFVNIITIFSLNIFIFSIIGMNIFSGVKLTVNGVLSENTNFDTFGNSVISLIRFSTGEDFPVMARELAVSPPYCIDSGPLENCGVPQATATIFFVFFFITSVMILAMLTAVILEAFDESSDEDKDIFGVYKLTPNIATLYSWLWVQEDKRVRMLLPIEKVQRIVASLPVPFGTGPPDALQRLQQLVGAYGGAATNDDTEDEEEQANKKRGDDDDEYDGPRGTRMRTALKNKKDRRSTVKRGVLRSISGKLMRTQSGALMETIDGIPATSLLAAARVVAKLPLIPSNDHLYSFYAVLLALCEQASRVTPLGAPINAIVSASAAAPPVNAQGTIGGSVATPANTAFGRSMNSDIEQPSLQETSAALLVQRRWKARKAGLLDDAEEAKKRKEAEDAASAEAAAMSEGLLTDSVRFGRGRGAGGVRFGDDEKKDDEGPRTGRGKSRF